AHDAAAPERGPEVEVRPARRPHARIPELATTQQERRPLGETRAAKEPASPEASASRKEHPGGEPARPRSPRSVASTCERPGPAAGPDSPRCGPGRASPTPSGG